jgi:hypothetical protein
MRIVYIFGAGASASIDNRVPVMTNFFEKSISMLTESDKLFWITFAIAEEARAFPPNPDIENYGVRIGVLGRLLEEIRRSKSFDSSKKIIEDKLTRAISDYKNIFRTDVKRISANLEAVFSKVEMYRDKSRASSSAYDRLQFLMGGLFNRLDKELSESFLNAAHHDLSNFVGRSNEFNHTFISFNYDLWLEKALFKKGVWRPRDGHGSYVFKYYSPPEDEVIPENGTVILGGLHEIKEFGHDDIKSGVKVLKPHGSLSWRVATKGSEHVVVIVEDDENSCVAYNNTWNLPPSRFQDGAELSLIPLIVAPTSSKIRSHQLLWKTDLDIVDALVKTDAVVIIGWSMPESDQYSKDMILRALNSREEQFKKVIVCNMGETSWPLSIRFEAIFRPKEVEVWDQGFNKKFVDFLQNKLAHT